MLTVNLMSPARFPTSTQRQANLLGASAIKCWCPVPNPPTCYSLDRHLSATVLSSTRPTHSEETVLPSSSVGEESLKL